MAVMEALAVLEYDPEAMERIGQRVVSVDAVSVADLITAGVPGRDVVAVRRALKARLPVRAVSGVLRREVARCARVLIRVTASGTPRCVISECALDACCFCAVVASFVIRVQVEHLVID